MKTVNNSLITCSYLKLSNCCLQAFDKPNCIIPWHKLTELKLNLVYYSILILALMSL